MRFTAYIRGIAELEPLPVHYLIGATSIPETAHVAIGRYEWKQVVTEEITLKTLSDRHTYSYPLPVEPAFRDRMELRSQHPAVRGGKKSLALWTNDILTPGYIHRGGQPFARVEFTPLVRRLKARGVKSTWPIKITLGYQVVPDD